MKKIILPFIFIAILSMSLSAQFKGGLKGGVNYSTISNYDQISIPTSNQIFQGDGNSKYRFGYNAGMFFNQTVLRGFVAFQLEMLYSNQGSKNTGSFSGNDLTAISGTYTTTTVLDYINIPLMLQIYFIPNILYIEGGPQVGFLVNSVETTKYSIGDFTEKSSIHLDNFNSVDFSLGAGVGFKFPLLPIGFNARYTVGMTELDKDFETNNNKTYNGVFQLSAFLKFGGKSK